MFTLVVDSTQSPQQHHIQSSASPSSSSNVAPLLPSQSLSSSSQAFGSQAIQHHQSFSPSGNKSATAWTPQQSPATNSQLQTPTTNQSVVITSSPSGGGHYGGYQYATTNSPAIPSSPSASSASFSGAASTVVNTRPPMAVNKMPLPIAMNPEEMVIKTEPNPLGGDVPIMTNVFSAPLDLPANVTTVPPQSPQIMVNQNATTNRPPPNVPPISHQQIA